jgi:hypothetical protein
MLIYQICARLFAFAFANCSHIGVVSVYKYSRFEWTQCPRKEIGWPEDIIGCYPGVSRMAIEAMDEDNAMVLAVSCDQ